MMRQLLAGYIPPTLPSPQPMPVHAMTTDGKDTKDVGVCDNLPASSGVRIWIWLLAIVLLAAEEESALPKRNDMARVIKILKLA